MATSVELSFRIFFVLVSCSIILGSWPEPIQGNPIAALLILPALIVASRIVFSEDCNESAGGRLLLAFLCLLTYILIVHILLSCCTRNPAEEEEEEEEEEESAIEGNGEGYGTMRMEDDGAALRQNEEEYDASSESSENPTGKNQKTSVQSVLNM